ncbi:MAG: hypothetical protein RPS47_11665 [Colwellia sp.]|jgi:hypothetical protein
MTKKFSPFTLLIEIGAPLVVPAHPVHLDALLWYCVGAHTHSSCKNELNTFIKEKCLEFSDEIGTFCASAMIMVATEGQGVSTASAVRVDHLHPGKLMRSQGVDFGKKKSILVIGGPFKKRMNVRAAHSVPYIAFHGVGDGERCASLMRYYLTGVGVDSSTSASGEIRSIDVLKHDDDSRWLLSPRNELRRTIPAKNARKIDITDTETPGNTSPPYFNAATMRSTVQAPRIIIETIHSVVGH